MRVITRTGRGDVPAVTEKHFRPATEKEFSKSAQRSTASSTAIAITAAVVSCTLLYWETLSRLVRNWIVDENYSHGFWRRTSFGSVAGALPKHRSAPATPAS
jgi:hypothetical protein